MFKFQEKEAKMIYKGRVRVTARTAGGCGFSDFDHALGYCVEAANIGEIKAKVEKLFDGSAQAWHDQTGCDCHGIVETVFHWDVDV
ncbi:MAG: hypothetical protein ABII19_02515 [Patescibacteria group bacterium]